ncbi:MAG: peptidylprolyl isomerase [Clostridia bacterium]|nr:peptidylprolyl isomerase [Clostridia bacterium]
MFKKVFCALLCVVLMLSLCACSNSPVIATYEGMSLDSSMYALHLAVEKRAVQEYLYYYYQMDISNTPAFWDEYYDADNKITWTDYINTEFCNMLVAMKFCKDHGISVKDESAAADIEKLAQDYIETAGSKDLLNIELAEYGADYDMLVEYLRSYQYISLMQEYLVSDGTLAVSDAEILEYLSDYWNFDYILFETIDSAGKPIVDKDITDEQAKDFFLSNYVTVKHVLYLTQNLSDDKKADKKAKAEAALTAIQSGEKAFEDFKKDNEDSNIEYTFTYGEMVSEFEKAAFEMEPGETRVVETAYGYHLMMKEELDVSAFDKMISAVKAAVTSSRIKAETEDFLEKLKNGEEEFKKSEDDSYKYGEGMVVNKEDDTMGKDLYELFKSTEMGDYFMYQYGSYGYYIFKRVEFDEKDVKEYSEKVSATILGEKFTKYINELAKSVEINEAEMAKYDIKTVRSFFSEKK